MIIEYNGKYSQTKNQNITNDNQKKRLAVQLFYRGTISCWVGAGSSTKLGQPAWGKK